MISAADYLAKSHQALTSSKLLLDAQDTNGASNRAYYAMFDAARYALMSIGMEKQALEIKTHNGMITAFSLHLVKTGIIDANIGKGFNKVEDIRLMADYLGTNVPDDKAQLAYDIALKFVETISGRSF